MMDGMMAGMGLWGLLVALTVVALLVLAVSGSMWFLRQLRDRRSADDGGSATVGTDRARDRLRERFAAGEIDEDEFERRLSALTHWR